MSFQAVFGDGVTVGADTYPILHEGWGRDVESRRLPAVPPEDAWVETRWLQVNAGLGGFSTFQADVHSRVGEPGAATFDQYGDRAELIVEELVCLFLGLDATAPGGKKWNVRIRDYDGAGPPYADTGGRLLVQVPTSGRWGEPSAKEKLGLRDGLWRWVLRWSVRMPRDTGDPAAYYTE